MLAIWTILHVDEADASRIVWINIGACKIFYMNKSVLSGIGKCSLELLQSIKNCVCFKLWKP